MWNEQLLLLALLAALFLPSSSQVKNHLEYDEIDDDCQLKTSIVLHKLDTFEREKSKDDFKMNQLWTDVVKETMGAMLKQQLEEYKSQLDMLAYKLEKVEKIEETLELVKTQGQENAQIIKAIRDCQQRPQLQNLDQSNLFSAEGKYFYFNKTRLTWNKARDWCAERGMKLAMLKTSSQMDAVKTELRERKADFWSWLGASDVGQPAGQFRWADGTLVDGTTWQNGTIYKYHGDSNEKTCVQFGPGSARLTDERCSVSQRILCQVPAALNACL